jgi:hypothetical protein
MRNRTTTDLAEAIDELTWTRGYLTQLRELLPTQPVTLDDGHNHRKVTGSPAPWNDEAASLLFEVHAAARRHEATLRDLLGFSQVARGNSDQATNTALTALPDLIAAYHSRRIEAGTSVVARIVRDLERWPALARRILDEDPRPGEERHTNAPGGLCCPYCSRRLVLKPGWQYEQAPALWCLRCPQAPDEDDHPRGRDLSWPSDTWIGLLQADETA